MSPRKVSLLLICEDQQQETFVRRFLIQSGWKSHQIRVKINPKGQGSGEQWVRRAYAQEVKILRSKNYNSKGLIVVIDQDSNSLNREEQLQQALREAYLAERGNVEKIAHFIPARNIETWLAYLAGNDVDETTAYSRLEKASDCQHQVLELKRMCEAQALRQPAPPSLARACEEFRLRVPGA